MAAADSEICNLVIHCHYKCSLKGDRSVLTRSHVVSYSRRILSVMAAFADRRHLSVVRAIDLYFRSNDAIKREPVCAGETYCIDL